MGYTINGYIWASSGTSTTPGTTLTAGVSYIYPTQYLTLIKSGFRYQTSFDSPLFNSFLNNCGQIVNAVEQSSIIPKIDSGQGIFYIRGAVYTNNGQLCIWNGYQDINLTAASGQNNYGLIKTASLSECKTGTDNTKICLLSDALASLPKATNSISGTVRFAATNDLTNSNNDCVIKDSSQLATMLGNITKGVSQSGLGGIIIQTITSGGTTTLNAITTNEIIVVNSAKSAVTLKIPKSVFSTTPYNVYKVSIAHMGTTDLTITTDSEVSIASCGKAQKIGSKITVNAPNSSGSNPIMLNLRLVQYTADSQNNIASGYWIYAGCSEYITIS